MCMNPALLYIHNLDPVILDIPGTPLALRWYGLAYVAGFVLGYLVLLALSKRKLYCVEPAKLGDFITSVCIFGVLCGGRLGEFFFYWLPEHGLSGFLADPLWVFRVWEGGMASHGGIIGVLLVAVYYARKYKWSLPALVDGLAIVSPIGLFFGRVANFINGELWGRVTDSWCAVKFPTEFPTLPWEQQQPVFAQLAQLVGGAPATYQQVQTLCLEKPAVLDVVAAAVPARYPSQMFEALGEGALIFVVLLVLRLVWKKAPAGIFSALFAFLYAAARITCECFKEPDAGVWFGVTQGQWLSLLIVVLGFGFLAVAWRNYRRG